MLPARGDEPLAPPSRVIAKSAGGTITVISEPESQETLVTRTSTGEVLWRIAGWHRWIFVADDGRHVVTAYDGMNLIPQDYDDDMVLLTFWREGIRIRDVTLDELVPDKGILRKTVSHYHWGGIERIDERDRLVVRRADDTLRYFDVHSGLRAE